MKLCYLSWNNSQDLLHIENLLKQDNIVVGTSDTIFGLLAHISMDSYQKLNHIKERFEKPYIVLIPNIDILKQLVKLPIRKDLSEIIKKFWPGPLTIIFNASCQMPEYMAPGGKIAIRMPHHIGLLYVLKKVGPLFSTSANISGQSVPKNIEEIDPKILASIQAVIEDGFQQTSLPSTIIDATDEQLRIVREGAIPAKQLFV